MISFIIQDPPFRYKIIEVVRFSRFAEGGFGVWPCGRVTMDAWGAEMLKCVCGDFDDFSVVEDEGLRTDAAFGDHGY